MQVKSSLGPDRIPHLCQLFVTADQYASTHIRFGGAVSSTCLTWVLAICLQDLSHVKSVAEANACVTSRITEMG